MFNDTFVYSTSAYSGIARPRYNEVETIHEAIECLGWFDGGPDIPDINCVEGQSTDRYTTPMCIRPEKKKF